MVRHSLALGFWLLSSAGFCQSDSILLTEIEVATHRVGKDISSSAPLFSLGEQDILKNGITDISDALHRLPGVTLRDYGGAGGMKTVSVRGFGSQHTGVCYDGLALSDCQTGQIDLQRYTMPGIESLWLTVGDNEDIFQPARNMSNAATLGFNSNIRSSSAQLIVGSWGYINPRLTMCLMDNGKSRLGASADFIYAENNYGFSLENVSVTTHEHRNHSRMKQGHAELNFATEGRTYSLNGKLYYYDNDRQLPGAVHYYVNDNDENLHEQNIFGQMQFRSMLDNHFSLKISGKWNWAMSDYTNGKPNGNIQPATYWQREGYASGALLYSPLTMLSFDYSADYVYNSLNGSTANISHPSRNSVLQALCGKWSDGRVTIVGKGLFGIYSSRPDGTETHFSPSVSGSFRVLNDKDFYLRASWKNSFRMPSFNELYYYHLGSSDLHPELAHQWNIGVAHRFSPGNWNGSYSVDIYYNKVEDKIVSVPVNMFVWRTVNIGKVAAFGTDLTADIDYTLSSRHTLGISCNYSLQRVENRTDKDSKYHGYQIAYTPEHSGSITARWTNPWVNVSVTGDGMSERWTTNEHSDDTRLAGFVEWSASGFRDFSVGRHTLTARASVTNIFNKQYDIVARYPMPGRGWKVSISYKF